MGNDNWIYKTKTEEEEEEAETKNLLEDNVQSSKFAVKKASRARKLLVLLSCIMQQLVLGGIGYGLSVMYAELIIVFNAKRSDVALIQSLFMGLSVALGIVFTGSIKRFGPGNSMIVGAIVSGIGLFASSFGGLTEIIVCTGVISAIGMCACYLAAFIAVSWMFHDDPGLYLTCLSFGTSLGQFIVPMLYELFIEQYTWTGAFILMAGIALQNVPCGLYVQFSKRYYVTGEKDQSQEKKSRPLCDMTLLKDIVLWLVWINFHLISLTGNLEAWFLVDIAVLRGFTRESGSTLVSTMGFANFIGRVSGAVLRFKCTRFPTVYHWVYLPILLAVGHTLIVNIHDYWGLLFVCVFYGLVFGVVAAQVAAIMFEAAGLERYPQAMAIANVTFGLANFIGGYFGGYMMDVLGSYDLVFYIAVGLSIYISLSTLIVIYLMQRRDKLQYARDVTVDNETSVIRSYDYEHLR